MLLRESRPDHQPLARGWWDHEGVNCDKMVCIHLHSGYTLSLRKGTRGMDWYFLIT